MNNFPTKVKNRQTKFHSAIKSCVLFLLTFRIPLFWPLTRFYTGLYYLNIFLRESIIVFLKVLFIEPMFRARCAKVGKKLRIEKLPYIVGEGMISVGNNVNISGRIGISFNDKVNFNPELVIGNNVFIGHEAGFAIAKRIEIGDHCYLASCVKIFDNDGHPLDPAARISGKPVTQNQIKPVQLCNNVWVGMCAIILKGVTVGENSIIGAGAIVTKDVPANSIVAGNPAQIIK